MTVHGCSDDEKGNAFLVHRSHSEGEWCCDVCDISGIPVVDQQSLEPGNGEVSGYEGMFS
jgi:hypothetical protein